MVVIVRAAGDGVRRHLAVHVEVGESRPTAAMKQSVCQHVVTQVSETRQDADVTQLVHKNQSTT